MNKLRTIDQGTVYDVPGKLTKLAREIRDGKHGRIEECVVAIRRRNEDGSRKTEGYWYGNGTFGDAIFMLELVKKDFLG
jgi:hypothetical protein